MIRKCCHAFLACRGPRCPRPTAPVPHDASPSTAITSTRLRPYGTWDYSYDTNSNVLSAIQGGSVGAYIAADRLYEYDP
jgi:hypothetical protein